MGQFSESLVREEDGSDGQFNRVMEYEDIIEDNMYDSSEPVIIKM